MSGERYVIGSGVQLEWVLGKPVPGDGDAYETIAFIFNRIMAGEPDENGNHRIAIQPGQVDDFVGWLAAKSMRVDSAEHNAWIQESAAKICDESKAEDIWLRNLEMFVSRRARKGDEDARHLMTLMPKHLTRLRILRAVQEGPAAKETPCEEA